MSEKTTHTARPKADSPNRRSAKTPGAQRKKHGPTARLNATETLFTYVTPELKDAVVAYCDATNMNQSQVVRRALAAMLRAKGFLPELAPGLTEGDEG